MRMTGGLGHQMYTKDTLISSASYRLLLALRMALFFYGILLFTGVGLIDAALCSLWPAWRSREIVPHRVSVALTCLLLGIFPLILVVPCSWGRPYRVLRLDYPHSLRPGESGWVRMSAQNTGGEVWQGGARCPCRLGVIYPLDGSVFHMPGEWVSAVRPAELSFGAEIAPAMAVDFHVPIQAPRVPGRYRETWGLLIEGRGWLPATEALNIQIEVGQEA
jgi:hypothetical protein